MKAYCILTVGEKISGISKSFFDNGEGMKGILVDAMADEYLFMMDDVLKLSNISGKRVNILIFIISTHLPILLKIYHLLFL